MAGFTPLRRNLARTLTLALVLGAVACWDPAGGPVACGAIPSVTVNAGETTTATACFTDPNGDMLNYSATSSNPGVATASVSGTGITVKAVAPGSASVTVTATDPGGLQGQQSFSVTVPNRAPQPRSAMPSITVPAGESRAVEASSYFNEPDGETLAYSATSSNPAVASVSVAGSSVTVTAVAKGTATVTVTATDPGGLAATQTFQATVPNRAPVAGDPIPDMEVFVGNSEEVDASEHFADRDGDALTYTVTSSASAVARVSASGSTVRVEAVGQGSATVTVTARDPEGLTARQTFEVTVPNRAPKPVGTIADREVEAEDTEVLSVAAYFTDPDGDRLTYAAVSSSPATARVSVSGSVVTVRGAAKGVATVTVTARDPEGLTARQTFEVTVPNRAPEPVGTIPAMEVQPEQSDAVDIAAYFTDPDGDRLTYAAVSSSPATARVSVSGSVVTVRGAAKGVATVTVTARDPEGLTARQTFEVTVPNRAPEPVGTIPAMEVQPEQSDAVDIAAYFTDPDGDRLTYAAVSSSPATARVSVSGSVVTVRGAAKGVATVTVTARDPEGLTARQTFEVTVPNRAPEPVGTIADREVEAEDTEVLSVAAYFTDPDGDRLTYAAESSRQSTARVSVSGSVVTVTGVAKGVTTVTVTARDPDGLAATQPFLVTVPNRAPVRVGTIPDRKVEVDEVADVDVAAYFRDPDGDRLAYAVESSSQDNARVSVLGSVVTVRGVAKGSATVTVTARDPKELAATQTFRVTVPNRAPEPVGTIPDRKVGADDPEDVDVAAYFRDPDGDRLAYAASSSNRDKVRVSVSGSVVTVRGVAKGNATVTVTARDGELEARQTFEATVANRAPVPVGTIRNRELGAGDTEDVDVAAYFTDPDGDRLTYAASSSDRDKVRVSVSGSTVTITALAKGTADITVTARDGELEARQTFEATVANRAPVPVGTIRDRKVVENHTAIVDVDTYFTDPDGDRLTHEAVSSSPGTARVSVSGSTVTITAVAKGTADIKVTARDPNRASAEQTFKVKVTTLDRAVLEELYDSLGGSNWTTNTNWLTDAHLNTWHGVTTNAGERVVRLELRANGLTGSIPAGIGRLRTLERLDLSENRVAPGPSEAPQAMPGVSLDDDAGFRRHALPEPPEGGGEAAHRDPDRLLGGASMSLQSTGIAGTIPRELGNLSNLVYLNLRQNSLTGGIPSTLVNLNRLVVLDLAFNSLDGTIPSGLGNLSNLEFLSFFGNSLTGAIPSDLGNLKNLRVLQIGMNSLTGPIPPGLGGLSNLYFLQICCNKLDGDIPSGLGNLSNLEFLSLGMNSLTGPIPSELGSLSKLASLFLSENRRLSGPLPLTLDGLPLEGFHYYTTNLCVPADPSFRRWLQGIPNHKGTGVDCLRRLTNNSATDSRPEWSPDGTRIAFESRHDGNFEIYAMDDDGGNLDRLTNNSATDYRPEWSPDGTRIAFYSYRDGNFEIYAMDDDGGNLDRLTNNSATDYRPEWSPDGTRIAFYSYRDGNFEIYAMDDDGGNLDRLTNNSATDYRPVWSPDGTRIAFYSYRDGNFEIYAMDDDGGNLDRLTNNSATDSWPEWSPDGTRIAFYSDRDGNFEIYAMDDDGGNLDRLTNNSATDYRPEWSPDGTRIAFYSDRDGNWEIYAMDDDGGNLDRLTNNSATDYRPEWSPDGTRIAFYSDRDGNWEIYVIQIK